MAALKGGRFCFIHDPALGDARSTARAKGGTNRRPSQAPLPASQIPFPVPPSVPPFELGAITRREDIAAALMRAARAVAAGELDTKRARIITEALRASELAFAAGGREDAATGKKAPPGAREATIVEMEHLVRTGQLPDGLFSAVDEPFWVRGAEWVPPAAALKNADE
jgi:hypothetical protein